MQIACFDTAFHANHEPLFTEYALPQTIRDQGIRRYGFHGLSYEWIAYSLRQDEPELAKGTICTRLFLHENSTVFGYDGGAHGISS